MYISANGINKLAKQLPGLKEEVEAKVEAKVEADVPGRMCHKEQELHAQNTKPSCR